MAQGSAGLAGRRGGNPTPFPAGSIRLGGLSGTALRRDVRCRQVILRLCRFWFRVNGFVSLDVSTESEPHGREHLFPEGVLLPRAESGIERRGEYVGGDRFLDRGLDGPAPLARILDKAGESLQLRILRQRGGAEIE